MKPGSLVGLSGGRRWLATGCLGAVVLAAGLRLGRPPGTGGVSTLVVQRGPFVSEVVAGGTLRPVKATPISVPLESGREQRIAFLARNGAVLKAGDLVVEFDPWDARKAAADGRSDLASAAAKIQKSRAEGDRMAGSLSLDGDVAKDGLERADTYRLADDQLYSRNQILEWRLDRSLYAKKTDIAGRKLATNAALAAAERALGEIEAGKAQAKIGNAEKSLRALRLLAPHDGLLVLERNWRGETAFVGDSAWPGEKLAEIPDLSRLEAHVFVLEADAAGLKPGLPARVAIEGRPGVALAATVTRVDALAKAREPSSPVRYFETVLAFEKTDPALMKPGQRVRATVRLEQMEQVLRVPRGALFERDGRRVLYRWQGRGFAPVAVAVGHGSASWVVVESGLREGDRVALRDPTVAKPLESPAVAPAGPARP